MFGLNSRILIGAALVVALMSGVIWWQYDAIQQLHVEVGGYEHQNKQLTADLNQQRQETNQLRYMMERHAELREIRDAEREKLVSSLRAEARSARMDLQADSDSAVWLGTKLPGPVFDRLCQLAGPDPNGDGVCDRAAGHGEGHSDAAGNR